MTHFQQYEPVEELRLERFAEKQYYPARIGDTLKDRHQIVAKLGFGAYSTVWLARDRHYDKYTSLKICVRDETAESPILNEIKALRHLSACPKEHPGSNYARLAEDVFQIDGHYCIVSKPQGCSLWTMQSMFPDGKVSKEIVAHVVQRLLGCANWLFCDCDVIHTEITAQNVLMDVVDDSIFRRIEEAELSTPTVPVDHQGYPVYTSRSHMISMLDLTGDPVLTDFGSSRSALAINDDWWMPDTHRAPEVLMGLMWDAQVDVWSIGIMALELLEGKNLFSPIDKNHSQYVLPLALSQYIGYMGPPPKWMIEQSKNPAIKTYFDEDGQWIAEPPIPEVSLENFVTAIEPGQEKDKFLKFIRRVLVWDPAERAQSAELFSDMWLMPASTNKNDE